MPSRWSVSVGAPSVCGGIGRVCWGGRAWLCAVACARGARLADVRRRVPDGLGELVHKRRITADGELAGDVEALADEPREEAPHAQLALRAVNAGEESVHLLRARSVLGRRGDHVLQGARVRADGRGEARARAEQRVEGDDDCEKLAQRVECAAQPHRLER